MKHLIIIFITAQSLGFVGCKNPLKEEKKKETTRVLVHDHFNEAGKYIVFWDGKDKNDKWINAGKYIYLMEVKDFQDQDFVTAQAGKADKNVDESHYEFGFYHQFELGQAYPNPFKIQSGVNIPFIVSEPATIKITIYKD